MSQPIVLFFHGLNTFGDNQFHAGPLVLGPMHQHWRPLLEGFGYDFYSIDKLGYGAFEDQVDRAIDQIERIFSNLKTTVSKEKIPVHLFGHSMGGLVARGVAAKLETHPAFSAYAKVRSVITIGSPHKGTKATEGALDLSKQSPQLFRLLQLFGYDLEKRRAPLEFFRAEKIRHFADRHPPLEGVECVSFIGAAPKKYLSFPYRVLYSKLHSGPDELSDGLIDAETQKWERVGGVFELDHFAELGAFLHVRPKVRRHVKREFDRLVSSVRDVIESSSACGNDGYFLK